MGVLESEVNGPREVAVRVVHSVAYGRRFAAAELDERLRQQPAMVAKDRALATELSYGVLRTLGALEGALVQLAPRGISDTWTKAVLLVAAYQLLLLDRVPGFAAVNEAVSLLRRHKGRKVAGFGNALLRRLSLLPPWKRSEALLTSFPPKLLVQMEQAVGTNAARALIGVNSELPNSRFGGTAVRFPAGVARPTWAEQGSPGKLSPLAVRFQGLGDVRKYPEYAEGGFVVQEEGAQLAGLALGAKPGDKVLDCCAGRGQKSSLLAEQIGPKGELWVTDTTGKKLDALLSEFERLGLKPPQRRTVRWGQDTTAELPRDFDRILVDAPCSGIGTLRRRPEIALRLGLGDAERLAAVAEGIVRQAAEHLAPGGRLLFVVCSILERECGDVAARVSDVLRPQPFEAPELSPLCAPDQSTLHLLPHLHDCDGFFLAHFVRR